MTGRADGLDLRRSLIDRTNKLRLIRPKTVIPATRAAVIESSVADGSLT